MTNDEITVCARNDHIIVKIGENLYKKMDSIHIWPISSAKKMRELARFLIVAKKENLKINSLNVVIDPCMFKLAIHSTRILCGYNEATHQFANPSLALKIGHQLKKCARIKKSECLMNMSVGREEAENFLILIESEWTNSISSNALQSITENKMNKTQILPLTEDIKTLTDHLNQTAENCIANLLHDFSKSDWETLNKVTLTHLVLFNRKRGGEVERLTVENYRNQQTNNKPMPEIESTLSPVEKMLCSTLGRVEIRGKKGRTVAVLLTPEMQKRIDILLKYREKAGVNTKNNFVFARANGESLNPIRMSDTLRTFRSTLNLSAGECLTSAKLRKHATVSQVLNLSRLDMAEFLGHDIDVHRSFYRLPQSTLQVAKMGKLLTAVNDEKIAKYSGLTLDEISLQDELSSDEDTDYDGDDDRTAEQEDESGSGLCQGPTESGLQPHQGPTESGLQPRQGSTKSALQPCKGSTESGLQPRQGSTVSGLQPCQGSTESALQTRQGSTVSALQPCQGSTESAIQPRQGSTVSGLQPRQGSTESALLRCHGPTEMLQKTKISSSTSALQGKKIQKLTSQQSELLRQLFCTNIKFRRELKMIDCTNAIKNTNV